MMLKYSMIHVNGRSSGTREDRRDGYGRLCPPRGRIDRSVRPVEGGFRVAADVRVAS